MGLASAQIGLTVELDVDKKDVATEKRKRLGAEDAPTTANNTLTPQAVTRLYVTLLCQKASLQLDRDHRETA